MGIVKMVTQPSPQSPLRTRIAAGSLCLCAQYPTYSSGAYSSTCAIYYTMRIQCYKCYSTAQVREQLWRLIYDKGWVSDHVSYMLFWIPTPCVPFALCIDPTLEPIAKLDYIS